MDEWLTTAEAAAHLGVKPQTLYAYVSRGQLARRPTADGGNGSLFHRDDVARLAARGSRRSREGRVDVHVDSAITLLDIEDDGVIKRVVFTGDLGRKNMPILRDPETPSGGVVLLTESTYGDRLHDPIEKMDDDLAAILKRTYDRGGKVIVPAFSLGRTQVVVVGEPQRQLTKELV